MAQSLVAGLEVVLRPLHRLSHPFALFRLSPLDIPQVSEYLMRWQKHLFPRIPQGKTLQGFKTRNIKIRDEDIHSTKVCPLLCRKLNSNAYWEAFIIPPSTSRSLRKFPCLASTMVSYKVKFSHLSSEDIFLDDCRRNFLYYHESLAAHKYLGCSETVLEEQCTKVTRLWGCISVERHTN